jgi:soluble lytic murein transglycosylase
MPPPRARPFVLACALAAGLILAACGHPDLPPAGYATDDEAQDRPPFSRAHLIFGDYFPWPFSGDVVFTPPSPWTLTAAHLTAGDGRRLAGGGLLPLLLDAGRGRGGDADAAGIAMLRRARILADQGAAIRAAAVYDSAAVLMPWLRDWITVFQASAAATAGDTAAVRQWYHQADSHMREWAWRVEPRARRQAGDRRGALAAAEAAPARLTAPARRAAAHTMAGQLRHERQDHVGARLAWLTAINTAEASLSALEAARLLTLLPGATAGDHLIAGRVFLRHGNLQRGTASLQAYADWSGAPARLRQQVQVEIAETAFRAGDYVSAERELWAIAEATSDSVLAARALFTAGRALFRSGRRAEALELLVHVVRTFDTAPASAQAAFLAADMFHDAPDHDAARRYYRAAIRIAPYGSDAAAAHMRLGGMAFADGLYHDALLQFEEFRRTHRSGRARQQAAFWAGMSASRLGDQERARQHFLDARDHDPISYYSGLAAEQIGDDAWFHRLAYAPPSTSRQLAMAAGALARIDALRAAGWEDAAAFEMERVRSTLSNVNGGLYALAEALNERGAINAGVSLAWDIYRTEGEWNSRLLRILYPFPFRDLIFAETRQRNVDPFLAAALIRQESMFNPGARSPVGAAGLMQVMPATAQSMARRVNVSRFTPDMLMRPELNVVFGTTYLADQLLAYSHRLDLVLAAYNAGPGRVSRWRAFPEYADHLLFAERIPFDETRDYVRVVLNNRRLYATLYAADFHDAAILLDVADTQ